MKWEQGSDATYAELGRDGALVDKDIAKIEQLTWEAGSTLETRAGKTARTSAGTYDANNSPFTRVPDGARGFDEDLDEPGPDQRPRQTRPGATRRRSSRGRRTRLDKTYPIVEIRRRPVRRLAARAT